MQFHSAKALAVASSLVVASLLASSVSLADEQQPPASDSSSTTPPTTTPAAPAAPSTAAPATENPTASPTTAPVTADAPQTAAEDPAKKPKRRPFAGSSLFIQNSMTTGTAVPGQTQSYNPTVESSAWFLPRYALSDAFQLRARAIVSYEYTNSDTTTYRNEPQLSDTTVSLFYKKIPSFVGIQPALAANVGVPTSKISRARTNIFTPGATLQLTRAFEHVLGGDWMLLTSANYSHPIYSSKNAEVVDARPTGAFQCVGGNSCQDLLTGVMNPSDTLSYAFLVSAEWGKWNPALYYLGANQWTYAPTEVLNPVDGTPIQSSTNNPTRMRQTHYFSAWVDYNFNSWLTAEVGYWNSRTALGADGQRGNIVFDRYQDSRVYLGASFQLDNLAKVLQGADQGEGGVVRAKAKTPMWTF